jgi:hypothetical protein
MCAEQAGKFSLGDMKGRHYWPATKENLACTSAPSFLPGVSLW